MKRLLLSVAIASHAFAHVSAAMWTESSQVEWLATLLLAAAFAAFIAGAICIGWITRYSHLWNRMLASGIFASVLWFIMAAPPYAVWGLFVNAVIATLALGLVDRGLNANWQLVVPVITQESGTEDFALLRGRSAVSEQSTE